jgi:hypothetical protein
LTPTKEKKRGREIMERRITHTKRKRDQRKRPAMHSSGHNLEALFTCVLERNSFLESRKRLHGKGLREKPNIQKVSTKYQKTPFTPGLKLIPVLRRMDP